MLARHELSCRAENCCMMTLQRPISAQIFSRHKSSSKMLLKNLRSNIDLQIIIKHFRKHACLLVVISCNENALCELPCWISQLDRIPAKSLGLECIIRKGFQQFIEIVVDTAEIPFYPHPGFACEYAQDINFT